MTTPAGHPRHYCRNCHHPLPVFSKYCPHCGQKDTDGRITLLELAKELAGNLASLDSKLFRTVGALFIPGKITEAHFEGKHQRYVKPLRLFSLLAILHFAVIGSLLTSLFDGTAEIVEVNRKQAHDLYFADKLELEKDTVLMQYPGNKAVAQAMDSLLRKVKPDEDTLYLAYLGFDSLGDLDTHDVPFAIKDVFGPKKAEELIKSAGVTDSWAQIQLAQTIKFNKSGDSFPGFILEKMIWMVLLMMPALALILKLLYIRRRRFFVEHLVFSFHYHAFAFLIMSVALLLSYTDWAKALWGETWGDLIISLTFMVILFYLFMAMRRVYKQGFIRTFVKFTFLNLAYLFLFTTAIVVTFLAAFLLF